MNLGKLLFVGNSVLSASATVSYRENKQVALPKFISPKNPFAPKPAAEPGPAPAKKEPGPAAAAQKAAPVPASAKSVASWTSRLNPASLWTSPGAEAKAPPAVQSELSLDAVKVVHNDLSDADVEVVPIKSRPAAAKAPDLSPAKKSWEILGERLLRATAL